jgi:hypothetical protein
MELDLFAPVPPRDVIANPLTSEERERIWKHVEYLLVFRTPHTPEEVARMESWVRAARLDDWARWFSGLWLPEMPPPTPWQLEPPSEEHVAQYRAEAREFYEPEELVAALRRVDEWCVAILTNQAPDPYFMEWYSTRPDELERLRDAWATLWPVGLKPEAQQVTPEART